MMWNQFCAITWAQFRTVRNHLPRTGFGAVLMSVLTVLWYGFFAALGAGSGYVLSMYPARGLERLLSNAFFTAFLFWQWLPLLTMSGGWSLQLKKLQVYPISTRLFFAIESALRLSAAPEIVLLLIGAALGLLWNPEVPKLGVISVLLYIPFNLFVTLAIRETLLHSFRRSRFRELLAVLTVGAAVLPQALLRTHAGRRSLPFWTAVSNGDWTPWHQFATLAAGHLAMVPVLGVIGWTGVAGLVAFRQFGKAMQSEETLRVNAERPERAGRRSFATRAAVSFGQLFRDPMGAIVEKEIRSLVRMPRFRMIFGMACVFSLLVFFPIAFGEGGSNWIKRNFLPVVDLYGLLLLADSLMWNVFGYDRSGAQIWYLAGTDLRLVLKAKNVTAALFVVLQNLVVLGVAVAVRLPIDRFDIVAGAFATAVGGLYFAAIGNLSSMTIPRAVDPSQTLRKQAGGQMQLWLLSCSAGMAVLAGFAFLARWAFDSEWALIGVFAFEFAVGWVVYRIALDSAVAKGMRERERILAALSKSGSPIAT